MSIELRNKVKVLESRIAALEARDSVDLSAIEARLAAIENRPRLGRRPKNAQ